MKKLYLSPLPFLLILTLLFSGCTEYQYITVKQKAPKISNSFISENDTVKVNYEFSGDNCPLIITVFNKLNKPVYVDWSQSSIIIKGKSTPLWSNNSRTIGSTNNLQINWDKTFSTSYGNFEAITYKDEKISFIPPHSYIRVSRVYLKNNFFDHLNKNSSKEITLATNAGGDPARMFSFSNNDSPMKFRVFLSVSPDKDFSKHLYMGKSFWTSDIISSYTKPEALVNKQNHQCYIKKTTGFGIFMGLMFALGLGTADYYTSHK